MGAARSTGYSSSAISSADDSGRLLRVVPSDGPRVHGLSSILYIGDEVWAWPVGGELLEAMHTGLNKRRDSKLLLISTAAAQLDSPLGRMRARALAQPSANRTGPVVEAKGDLHWLEWSVPDEIDLSDLDTVERASPAPWITIPDLRRQRAAVPDPPRLEERQAEPRANIDAIIALCMAVERAEEKPEPVQLPEWL